MEDYIGKICPFCKTEIKEGDSVKVCPSCGIPHHEACWEENKGCTTFGCSEQHYEEQHTNPTDVCANCGAPLGDGQDFCPKCGTPKGGKKKNICSKCGAELEDGQAFCPKCGQKADLQIDSTVNSAISQFNATVTKAKEQTKKKNFKLIIAGVAAVLVLVLAVTMLPKLFKSSAEYMAMGNYEKAYSAAKSSKDKDEVAAENIIAVCSASCVDMLKDSKSFDLRDGWYDSDSHRVVLKVAANNSYGNTVLNYWYFTYDSDDKDWELWDTYTDFDEEEYSKYDTENEKLEKLFHNLGIDLVKGTMVSNNKLSNSSVKRINALFADDLLDDVELIEAAIPVKNESN